tara:strand:+ start:8818 stop:9135 length:318 start_codon:yes stop_codon:yes gene_type:complete
MVKFLAIDANGLNMLFSGSDVTFENPHCKNKDSIKQLDKTFAFSKDTLTTSHVIAISGYCISQFQFEVFSWEASVLKHITHFNEHITTKLNYLYLDNTSPPPRLA